METLTVGLNNGNRLIYPLSNQTPSSTITPNSVYCFENKCFSSKIVKKGSNTFSLKMMDSCGCVVLAIMIFFLFCCLFFMIIINYFLFTSNPVKVDGVIFGNLALGVGIIIFLFELA